MHSLAVLTQEAVNVGRVRAKLAEKLFADNFSVRRDVIEERALLGEGRPAGVAEVLPPACQQVCLIVVESRAIGVHPFAGHLFRFNVDANVVAKSPTMGEDSVTLQALVTIVLTILKHRSNLKFIRSFTANCRS